jgi:hypothetical protein
MRGAVLFGLLGLVAVVASAGDDMIGLVIGGFGGRYHSINKQYLTGENIDNMKTVS